MGEHWCTLAALALAHPIRSIILECEAFPDPGSLEPAPHSQHLWDTARLCLLASLSPCPPHPQGRGSATACWLPLRVPLTPSRPLPILGLLWSPGGRAWGPHWPGP